MLKGRVVARGDTATVFSPPYHPYTELLLSSVPEMRPDWLDEVLAKRAAGAATTSALLKAYPLEKPRPRVPAEGPPVRPCRLARESLAISLANWSEEREAPSGTNAA